ncbi:hypothetical protein AVEN_136932-1 [Araneus ventricosus]|uniref:Uncharacterized protein n=1 Tax=Araneus ventricosus TaxID=182803 RepID=A0A4Y2BJV3_ARAVE|nr:hypothetical protein AVEN_136932-1 [Araneus ventricosus]
MDSSGRLTKRRGPREQMAGSEKRKKTVRKKKTVKNYCHTPATWKSIRNSPVAQLRLNSSLLALNPCHGMMTERQQFFSFRSYFKETYIQEKGKLAKTRSFLRGWEKIFDKDKFSAFGSEDNEPGGKN